MNKTQQGIENLFCDKHKYYMALNSMVHFYKPSEQEQKEMIKEFGSVDEGVAKVKSSRITEKVILLNTKSGDKPLFMDNDGGGFDYLRSLVVRDELEKACYLYNLGLGGDFFE